MPPRFKHPLNMTPRYTHDCKACVFLGRNDNFDTYWCPAEAFSKETMGGSVVARYGNEGAEYASGPLKMYLTTELTSVDRENLDSARNALIRAAREVLLDDLVTLVIPAPQPAQSTPA
jgi:hypothetical protein